jgi:hypothetical protein
VSGPNYNQDQYASIDLMFEIALIGKLFYKGNDEKGNPSLIKTPRLESYLSLSDPEKYVFLLETYWTKYDFDNKFERWVPITGYYNFIVSIANVESDTKIVKDVNHGTERMFSESALFLHHLRFFGLGELELIEGAKGKYEDTISAFIPNSFGIETSKFLLLESIALWNRKDLYFILESKEKNNIKNKNSNPFTIFKNLFSGNIDKNTVDNAKEADRNGVYTFKVSLSKNLWRKINIAGKHTLGNLHDAIQDAFDFDNDHLYAFYIGGNRKTGKPIYCRDTEDEGAPAEETTIESLELFKGQKLVYLFDFGDMWEFNIELTEVEKETPVPMKPIVIESKGESPEQYGGEW